MIKWTQKLHDYWKGKCEDDSLELPESVTNAIYAFIQQIEYLRNQIAESADSPITKLYNNKILSLELENETLRKKLSKYEKPSLPVAIFYKNGKPTKKKPK